MTDFDRAIEEAWPKSALAEILPYESWERLPGETSSAFAAFCAFRDCAAERNISKAVDSVEKISVPRVTVYYKPSIAVNIHPVFAPDKPAL